jgi:two-component system NtrC family sensor kinase
MSITMLLILWVFVPFAPMQSDPAVDSLKLQLESSDDQNTRLDLLDQLFRQLKDNDSLDAIHYGQEATQIAIILKQDSIACALMYDVGWTMLTWGNTEAAGTQFQDLLEFAKQRQFHWGIASGYKGLGDVLRSQARFREALDQYFIAMDHWNQTDDWKGMGYTYNNIGVVYRTLGNTPEALTYYLKAVSILEQINDLLGLGYITGNIGNIHYENQDYPEAIEFHQKSYSYSKELKDSKGIAFALNNMGLCYAEINNRKQALVSFHESLSISESANEKEGIINAIINLGTTHLQLQAFDSAEFYLQNALNISDQLRDLHSKTFALIGLGDVRLLQGNFDKAVPYFEDAVQLSQEIDYKSNLIRATEKLSLAERGRGNFESALEAYMLYNALSESLYNSEQTEKLVRIQTEYEFQQERDSVQFAREKERLTFQQEIEHRKANQLILVIVLVVISMIIILVIFYNRKLQELNHAVTKQRDELEKVNKTKSRFFSIIAHDIRGPMNLLMGYGDMVHMYVEEKFGDDKDEELEQLSGHLKQSTRTVLSLLDSLLTWAIKEEGALNLQKETLTLTSCIEENFEVLGQIARSKKIQLTTDVDPTVKVCADKNSLMVILRNLINNALKFTPENGQIKISATAKNERIQIQVSDTGVGIPEDKIKLLFDINEEKVTRGTKGEGGSGLGLKLVYDFVKLNDGQVSVESEEGKGTTFTVTLPIAKD